MPNQDPPQDEVQALIDSWGQGQFQQVLEKTKRLLEAFPDSFILYSLLGAANAGLSHFDAAIASYKQALRVKPDYADGHYNLANALKQKGDLEAAIDSYRQALKIGPETVATLNNLGNALHEKGDLEAAIDCFRQALKMRPDIAEAHANMGRALHDKGDLEAAISSFKQALRIQPDFVAALVNLGNAQRDTGDLQAATSSFERALKIKPDSAEAHANLGTTHRDMGDLEAAIRSYKQALEINPDYFPAWANLGNALNKTGDLDGAIHCFKQTLRVKPDIAEAYNNMGNALYNKGELEAATDSYKQALQINPGYAEALWNLSGTAKGIEEAGQWIEKCLAADQSHQRARIIHAALGFCRGDRSDFDDLMQSDLKEHPYTRSCSWIFSLPKIPSLYFNRWAFFDAVVERSIKDRPFYEFGVWRGDAFRYLIKTFNKGYGFDTFTGLPEDWHAEKAGTYTSEGNIPDIEGGEFIAGKFDDSLPIFFSTPRPMASIINFDADLYSSTLCALNYSKPVIDGRTILIFDELIMNEHWEQDEIKALNEFCSENDCAFEVVAASFFTKQVAVKLTGI